MKDEVSIAIVAPVQPEDFFDQLWQGVWEATFDLASFGVEVQNLTTERYAVEGQRRILEHLLEERVDAIAVIPAHASALDDLIAQHESAGTLVVTFHGDAPASRRSAFVGAEPFQAGVLAAEVLLKLMGNRGRVISFPGSIEKYHLAQRYAGFRSELARHAGLVSEEEALAGRWLSSARLESGDAVYVGDEDLVDVATALERAGVQVPCIGFGSTDSIRPLLDRRAVSAVVDASRYQEGYFAVQKAYQSILMRESGESLSGVQIPSTVVFASNADTGDSLRNAFEMVVRQRTEILFHYKQRLEQANAELMSLSITDPLTGLLNRRKFEEVMANEVARARRYGDLSLLMIDVDRFKSVNDRHGHPAGDEVLRAIARVLKKCCRATDTCARLGGDEFALILPHSDNRAADIVRERIGTESARTRVPTGRGELEISLSIGAATMPTDASDSEGLIAAADADMYRVKHASKMGLNRGVKV